MGPDDTNAGEPEDSVRLVDRDEAERALRSGNAIGRRPLAADFAEEDEGSLVSSDEAGADRESVASFPLPPSHDLSVPPPPRPIGPSRSIAAAFGSPARPPVEHTSEVSSEPAETDEEEVEAIAAAAVTIDTPATDEIPDERVQTEEADAPDSNIAEEAVIAPAAATKRKKVRGQRFRFPRNSSRALLEAGGAPVEELTTAERVSSTFRSASMKQRVTTAAFFAVVAVGAFLGGPAWTLAMATLVISLCAIELFDGLRRVGFRPATLLAIAATVGVILGAYARGEAALPVVTVILIIFSFIWYLGGVSKAPATINIAVTVFGFVWVGILGAHAALLLRIPNDEGLAFFIGAVLITIAYDTGAYLGGSTMGRHVMAPDISPNKTWEGLTVGTICAIAVGAVGVGLIHPFDLWTGAALGLVVAIVAPLGDLAESMIKRDLGLKDMGRVLPGHGGLLDRFDALLFVLPATFYLVHLLNLV